MSEKLLVLKFQELSKCAEIMNYSGDKGGFELSKSFG